jgi:hypothetical protein
MTPNDRGDVPRVGQVVQVGRSPVDPMRNVVGFQVPGGLTVGSSPVVAIARARYLLVADQALRAPPASALRR